MTENPLYKIGITHGDFNGISYEIIIKALADNKLSEICTPIIYGIPKAALFYRKRLNLPDFSFQAIKNADQAGGKKVSMVSIFDNELAVTPGISSLEAGKMAALALEMACGDLKSNKIDAVVTAPINKSNMPQETFPFKGHTEFFAHHFSTPDAMMLMISDSLKMGFVTHHLPIEEVPKAINEELILKKIQILERSLKSDFLLTNPKIAVLALNPHAGDHGVIGKEDEQIIMPAIKKAFELNINVFGPFPSDGFFASGQYQKFDAVLAMYHDQGMIPFKLLSCEGGVNFTAGLPIVRTSPAHGTAYDICDKNIASEQSLRNAIYWAIDIVRNRQSKE